MAAAVDSTDPNAFGGLPYYLIESGKSLGLIDGGLPFKTDALSIRVARCIWNFNSFLNTAGFGGFQYSDIFLSKIWNSVDRPSGNYKILNIFQLYPEAEMQFSANRFFYLDQTLNDVFEYYKNHSEMHSSLKMQILQRERAQYHASGGIIFRSNWAAERAIKLYELPKEKVHVVLPGANILQSVLDEFDSNARPESNFDKPLKLIFIGKEWRRKGLDRLLRAMRIAQSMGEKVILTVIGAKSVDIPKELTDELSIRWLGFFDKSRDPLKFVNLLAEHDLGVLLSRSEAGGVSLREFGRIGLPVIAPDTGGSPEFAMSEDVQLFSPDDTDEKIAQVIVTLANDRRMLNEMKARAWDARYNFDWRVSVAQLANLL